MDTRAIREQVEAHGTKQVSRVLAEAITNKTLKTSMLSFKKLFEAFWGYGSTDSYQNIKEAISDPVVTADFSYAIGSIMAKEVIDAYQGTPSVLDTLVRTIPSKLKTERFVGLNVTNVIADVAEYGTYPEAQMGDRAVSPPEPVKRGEMISLTWEDVFFDNTNQILVRAQGIGNALKLDRERRGFESIQDQSLKAWYPNVGATGTQTDLWRTSAAGVAWYNKNVNTISGDLDTWEMIDEALQQLATMLDDNGDYIGADAFASTILVPRHDYAGAVYVVNATGIETVDGNTTTVGSNLLNLIGKNNLNVVTSPFLDDGAWYLGNFKKMFIEQEHLPIQVEPGLPDVTRDIVATYRARYKSRVYAISDAYVVKSLGH